MGWLDPKQREQLEQKLGVIALYMCDHCNQPIVGEIPVMDSKGGTHPKKQGTPDFLPRQPKLTYHQACDKAMRGVTLKRQVQEVKSERKELPEDMAKKTKKVAKTRTVGVGGKVGIIDTILETLQRPEGATQKEILAVLTKKFKDRDPEKMLVTIQHQVSPGYLPAKYGFEMKKERDSERGLVYKAPARIAGFHPGEKPASKPAAKKATAKKATSKKSDSGEEKISKKEPALAVA